MIYRYVVIATFILDPEEPFQIIISLNNSDRGDISLGLLKSLTSSLCQTVIVINQINK